jgi:hypothetical protein
MEEGPSRSCFVPVFWRAPIAESCLMFGMVGGGVAFGASGMSQHRQLVMLRLPTMITCPFL